MRRASSTPSVGEVFKRDGRCEPFARDKLARALDEALAASGEAPAEAPLGESFADIVHTALLASRADAAWTSGDVAGLALEVLESAGCVGAAQAWRAVDRARRSWRGASSVVVSEAAGVAEDRFTKGRLVAWMSDEAAVEPSVADDVAASVERRLFASGLVEPHDGLVREWVDHELARRGVGARVGRGCEVSIAPDDLRRRLADARPGDDAVRRAGRRVLERYAEREIYPSTVIAAHERGHLALDDLHMPARVHEVVVRAADVSPQQLHDLRAASAAPVVVLLDDESHGIDVESHRALSDVEFFADSPGVVRRVLDAVVARNDRGLRGSTRWITLNESGLADAWLDAESVRDTLTLRRIAPPAGVTEHTVAINAAGLALDVVDAAGAADRFVARLSRTVLIADQAFAARRAIAGPPAWPDAATLDGAHVSQGPRLALAGLDVAFNLLGVSTPRAASDLATRVHAALGRPVHLAANRLVGRFAAEDLARHPELRDRHPLSRARNAFAYHGAIDAHPRVLAHLVATLLDPAAPLPRTIGRRAHFLRSLSSSPLAPRPCA